MSDQCIGEIRMFAGNFAPEGWAFCDGRLLPISGDYQALFSLIGTTYGGDGRTNFGLPDLRGRVPIGPGKSTVSSATYSIGQYGGAETATLIPGTMPAHSHAAQGQTANGTLDGPQDGYWASPNGKNQYLVVVADKPMMANIIDSTGGSLPHENMMPYLPLSFIIAFVGVYPERS